MGTGESSAGEIEGIRPQVGSVSEPCCMLPDRWKEIPAGNQSTVPRGRLDVDSFEDVVAATLQRQGYWTRTSVKVDLTREDKRRIGRPSCPRWELDVVGYRGRTNEILVMECKSLLDSYGVQVATFEGKKPKDENRYKLFFQPQLREVVLERLVEQLVKQGSCRAKPRIKLGLAAGKIYGDAAKLASHFEAQGWELWTPSILCSELRQLGDGLYENSVAAVVAKLLLRVAPSPGKTDSPVPRQPRVRAR